MRTPLTVGYLWLVLVWLLWGDKFPKTKPASGPVANLFELSQLIGRPATIAAFSFVAYVLGAALTVSTENQFVSRWLGALGKASEAEYLAYLRGEILKTARRPGGGAWDSVEDLADSLDASAASVDLRPRLLVANQGLYGEYDRLAAEATFRLNLVLPTIALTVVAGFDVAWFWLLVGLPISVILLWQGTNRQRQSQEVIHRAVLAGLLDHPAILEARQRRDDELARSDYYRGLEGRQGEPAS